MFQPINDFVLVEPIANLHQSEAGLVLPDMAKDLPVEGVVLACGPGRHEFGRLVPMEVRVGDKIKFGKFAGVDITIEDVAYRVMREEEIMGILAPDSVPDATGDSVCV